MLNVIEQQHTVNIQKLESTKASSQVTRSSLIGLLTACPGSLELLIMAVVPTASILCSAAIALSFVWNLKFQRWVVSSTGWGAAGKREHWGWLKMKGVFQWRPKRE